MGRDINASLEFAELFHIFYYKDDGNRLLSSIFLATKMIIIYIGKVRCIYKTLGALTWVQYALMCPLPYVISGSIRNVSGGG